jgi:hypothetical protein
VTASNLFKYCEPAQGVVLFRHHDPLAFNAEQLADLVAASHEWMLRSAAAQRAGAEAGVREQLHPLFVWNCLPRAGASQFHGHAQVRAPRQAGRQAGGARSAAGTPGRVPVAAERRDPWLSPCPALPLVVAEGRVPSPTQAEALPCLAFLRPQVMLSSAPFPTLHALGQAAAQYALRNGGSGYWADVRDAHGAAGLLRTVPAPAGSSGRCGLAAHAAAVVYAPCRRPQKLPCTRICLSQEACLHLQCVCIPFLCQFVDLSNTCPWPSASAHLDPLAPPLLPPSAALPTCMPACLRPKTWRWSSTAPP